MPKKKSMSIEDVFKEVKKGIYKEAVQNTRAAYKRSVRRNKNSLVCFVGISPTISFETINND